MSQEGEASNLEELLDQLREAEPGRDRISLETALEAVGRRSFGPILLLCGLFVMSPLGAIPGAPTIVGLVVVLTGGQILVGRSTFWIPGFVLRRSVSRSHFTKAVKATRPVARFTDRLLKRRLAWLTEGVAVQVIAAMCILLALIAPLLEVLPWSITGVGAAWIAFGLALIADDGLAAGLALVLCVLTGGGAVWFLFF